ncbi:MAG: glutamate--tRNA ligase [Planctomycetes bacterium]|nr:glutamate--tRNA ligase [Planctomycetota bacterium]
MTVRTRIAPSPTGDPHVGTGYMGLVNMVLARQHGGQFLLRIDDTDRTRYRAGSEQAVFDALRWLGLEWDEGPDKGGPCGPYRQSERTAIYLEHALMLVKSGHAYRCFCTSDELAARRAEALAEKRDFRGYDGRCRALDPEDAERRAGEPHVIRFKCPTDEGKTVIQDLLRGPIETPNAELDDKVLLKSDGFPTYHLASVVDDHLFRISHIIRAEEWIPSGPLHQLLFEAYGWDVPVFCHMPLIRNADKSKISKRKNPTSLLYYRDAGYLPQALLNFLGLLGWGGPKTADGGNQEIFSVDDMLQHFKLETLSLGGPVFDLAKLRHVNAHYLRELQPQAFAQQVRDYLVGDPAYLEALVPLVSPRMETLGQFLHVADFFFSDVDHVHPDDRKLKPGSVKRLVEGLVPAGVEPEDAWFTLSQLSGALERLDAWTAAELEQALRGPGAVALSDWKPRDLFMALRVAISGRKETPGLFECLEVLGKSRVLGRLADAMRVLPAPGKKRLKKLEKARDARIAGAATEASDA